MQRSLARQAVLQLLYERLSGGENDEESIRMILGELPLEKPIEKLSKSDRLFVNRLLQGAADHEEELRQLILPHLAEGWTMERLNRIDLCILLLGSFEICYTETPDNVVISEAMKMADLFTEEKNKRFINAVLGAVSRGKPQNEEPPEE